MLCRNFMVRSSGAQSTVLNTATLGEALAKMVKHHLQQLLVVNAEGEFLGEVTTFTLAKLLLPETKNGEQTQAEAEDETVGDVDDRITPHLGRKVADYVDQDLPIVTPNAPLSEALKHLASGRLRLPVIDPEAKTLVGVISPLTILRRYQF